MTLLEVYALVGIPAILLSLGVGAVVFTRRSSAGEHASLTSGQAFRRKV